MYIAAVGSLINHDKVCMLVEKKDRRKKIFDSDSTHQHQKKKKKKRPTATNKPKKKSTKEICGICDSGTILMNDSSVIQHIYEYFPCRATFCCCFALFLFDCVVYLVYIYLYMRAAEHAHIVYVISIVYL